MENKKEARKKYAVKLVLLFLIFVLILVWYALFYYESRQDLLVDFFDIGQGDAVFIEIPNGIQVLIDGGPDDKVVSKLGEVMPFWDKSIDLVILTHPEKDHITGLLAVLKRYKIDYAVWPNTAKESAEYKEWLELVAEQKAKVVHPYSGMRITLGSRAYLDILAPFIDKSGKIIGSRNNVGIVGKLVYSKKSFLFTADVERQVENRLVYQFLPGLDADVLKVGHHGSRTSSTDEFIRAVSPDVAVISVGKDNRYGHPHKEVVDRLKKYGTKIFRTDINGDIILHTDGINLYPVISGN